MDIINNGYYRIWRGKSKFVGRIISINKSFFQIYRKLYEELYRNLYRGLYEINRITQGILGFIEAIIRRIIGIGQKMIKNMI